MNVDTKKLIFIGPMDLPEHFEPRIDLQNRSENLFIIIDGGLNHIPKELLKNSENIYLIGDGDSISDDSKLQFTQKLPKEKDLSDLQAGVNYILEKIENEELKSIQEMHFYGFSEKRIDHYLYNIGVISRLTSNNFKIFQYTHDGVLQYIPAGVHHFNHQGLFSILNFSKTKLSLTGQIKYPLLNFNIEQILDNRLLSNQAQGKFTITNDSSIIIYLNNGRHLEGKSGT